MDVYPFPDPGNPGPDSEIPIVNPMIRDTRVLLDAIGDPVMILDPFQNIEFANAAFCRITGMALHEVIGKPCYTIMHQSTAAPPGCPFHKSLKTRKPAQSNMRIAHNGRVLMVSTSPVIRDGTLKNMVHISKDITEHVLTEDALRISEARLAEAQRIAGIGNWEWDIVQNRIWWSDEIFRLFGLPISDLTPTYEMFLSMVHPEDREQVENAVQDAMDQHIPYNIDHRIMLPNGKIRVVNEQGRVRYDETKKPILMTGTVHDITDRVSRKKHLEEARKMEAIARLTGGVAHDFNNLLSIINGYAELMMMRTDLNPEAREILSVIQGAGEKAGNLTRQLLAFSRRQILIPKMMDLNAVILKMKAVLIRLLGNEIGMETELMPGPALIYADPTQVEQVLMNLAVNAKDAMIRGGTFTIRTQEVDLIPEKYGSPDGLRPGKHIRMQISDNGPGMEKEVQEKLFEPFFSTKKTLGSGLGLSTVLGIVKQHGGHIRVTSTQGTGTCFEIDFPAKDSGSPHAEDFGSPASECGNKTIVVVADQPGIRRIVADILTPMGHGVIEMASPENALAILANTVMDIDLLITDVVMPEMNGAELVKRMRKFRPFVKVVYMSGAANWDMKKSKGHESITRWLRKPVTPAQLTGVVRDLLGPKPAFDRENT